MASLSSQNAISPAPDARQHAAMLTVEYLSGHNYVGVSRQNLAAHVSGKITSLVAPPSAATSPRPADQCMPPCRQASAGRVRRRFAAATRQRSGRQLKRSHRCSRRAAKRAPARYFTHAIAAARADAGAASAGRCWRLRAHSISPRRGRCCCWLHARGVAPGRHRAAGRRHRVTSSAYGSRRCAFSPACALDFADGARARRRHFQHEAISATLSGAEADARGRRFSLRCRRPRAGGHGLPRHEGCWALALSCSFLPANTRRRGGARRHDIIDGHTI